MADMIPTQPWQSDLMAAQRRRQLAQTLMQGVMAPTQGGMVGRYYVGEGLGGGLARLGQALLARKFDDSADQSEQDALTARNAANTQAFNDLSQSLTPTQETQTAPTGTDGNLVQAMTKTVMHKPTPQQIGQALLRYQQTTGQQVPDSYLKMLNPEPVKVGQGETLLNPSDNSVIYNNPKTPDGMMAGPDGAMSWIPGYIGGKVQIAQAGRPTTNVNVSTGKYNNALAEAQGKSDAELLNELRGNARSATQAINTLSSLEGLSDKVFSGAGANTKLGLEQWFGGLGIPMSQEAINSENFKSIAGDLVLKQIKMLGANPTDSDRRFIEQLVPQLESSSAARLQLIQYLKKRAQSAIDDYKGANDYAAKNGSLSGYIGSSQQGGSDVHPLDQ